MTREEIASALDEIALLLELKGENAFRCQAYSNGARAIEQLEGDPASLLKEGKLVGVRGIGEALLQKITTLITTGELPYLTNLRTEVPPGFRDMLKIQGLGAKKIRAINEALGVTTIEELQKACEEGKVAGLKGFGDKSQAKIVEGIRFLGTVGQRVRIDQALPLGLRLLEQIKQMPGVIRAELCGSLRRRRETAKDLDILVSANDAKPIMDAFVTLPEVMQVIGHGATKSSIVAGMKFDRETVVLNADLRVVEDVSFPFALHYFTGSKDHNIRMRQRAIDQGLSLNEYALAGPDRSVACKEEADIFAALGLEYIPPELREDTGEIPAAEKKQLPKLVEANQIRGVFHNHTVASDGANTLEEMAGAAQELGLEYLGIGDHSQSLKVANGLSPERVREQWAAIDALNSKFKKFRILKGIESDILKDGSLDYDDEFLKGFDYVVASVHSDFNLPIDEQTRRICTALKHPATTMLGHATGRLLLRREGYKVDLDEVLRTAKQYGKLIEINAQPSRLDLDWTYVKRAKAMGVQLVINPDAHSTHELGFFTFGVDVARRGWLTPEEVFNTKSLAEVLKVWRLEK
jgi:DNA polymerase (family X)